jgi:hypothetical protein
MLELKLKKKIASFKTLNILIDKLVTFSILPFFASIAIKQVTQSST